MGCIVGRSETDFCRRPKPVLVWVESADVDGFPACRRGFVRKVAGNGVFFFAGIRKGAFLGRRGAGEGIRSISNSPSLSVLACRMTYLCQRIFDAKESHTMAKFPPTLTLSYFFRFCSLFWLFKTAERKKMAWRGVEKTRTFIRHHVAFFETQKTFVIDVIPKGKIYAKKSQNKEGFS